MFFQPEIETMPRRDLEALQLERLKWTVDYCYRNVPFYTKKLDEAGVTADKIGESYSGRFLYRNGEYRTPGCAGKEIEYPYGTRRAYNERAYCDRIPDDFARACYRFGRNCQ